MAYYPEQTTKVWHGMIYVGSFLADNQKPFVSMLVVLPDGLPKDQEGRAFIVVPTATEVDELISALQEHKKRVFEN